MQTTRRAATYGVSYGASRVYLLTQLVSQVLPPSSENACLDCAASGVVPQIENRTRMVGFITLGCNNTAKKVES